MLPFTILSSRTCRTALELLLLFSAGFHDFADAAPLETKVNLKRNNDGATSKKLGQDSTSYKQYYQIEGHRGARGEAVESTLAAFAHGLIGGAAVLELDNGISKDGHAIVWHDESIDPTKCKDTGAAFSNDPMYPYVGKLLANLTLAQLKTLDCGSLRLQGFPLQLTYPGHKLATLPELFDFVNCVDAPVLFNIESKINPVVADQTRSPEDFVDIQLKVFKDYGLVDRITYQSFDWRSLILSKKVLPELRTVALADDTTLYARTGEADATSGPSDWLAGIDIDNFTGKDPAERLVRAAKSIGASILSPGAQVVNSNLSALDPSYQGYESFVNSSMIKTADSLGLKVVPYTINRLTTQEQLDATGTDGVITDYPAVMRAWADKKGYKVAPVQDYETVNKCFRKHAEFTDGKVRDLL